DVHCHSLIAELVQGHRSNDGVGDSLCVERPHKLLQGELDLGFSHKKLLGGLNPEPEAILDGLGQAGRGRHTKSIAVCPRARVAKLRGPSLIIVANTCSLW